MALFNLSSVLPRQPVAPLTPYEQYLMQQAVQAAPQTAQEPDYAAQGITVEATLPPVPQAPVVPVEPVTLATPTAASVMNTQGTPDVQVDPRTGDVAPGTPERKGMFGVKGTLRDVLGTIGDALLIGSGKQAIYAPGREKERLSDSIAGFGSATPEQQRLIIDRVMRINPEVGLQMLKQYQANILASTETDLREKQMKATSELAKGKQAIENFEKGSKLLSQAASNMLDPTRYNPAVLQGIADRYELDVEIPQTFDPNVVRQIVATGTPRSTQIQETQGQQRIGLQERNTRANEMRAARPPAGRAQPQPTVASVTAPILAKIARGEKLTEGEQQALSTAGLYEGKGQKSGIRELLTGSKKTSAKSGGSKFQPGQIVTKGGKRYRVNADGKTATPL